jgi:hypothetical protein
MTLTVLVSGDLAAQGESTPPAAVNATQSPPYSLPFQLRPVLAGNAVRSDTAYALYKDPVSGNSGSTVASMFLVSYKVAGGLAPLIRVGVVSNSPPSGPSGFNLLNPVLGATYAMSFGPSLKLGLFLGLTAPVGSGGGDSPNGENVVANAAGIRARSAMDNAMFAVNDFTVFPGVGLAYVRAGFTAQGEVTLLQLTRVRGSKAQPDSSKTNFTAGLHVGYFFIPQLSFAAELRHQRWLSTPKAVQNDATGTLRDTTTVAFGPRVHIKLASKVWLRPAVTLALPIDDPMKAAKYKIVQLDLPISF